MNDEQIIQNKQPDKTPPTEERQAELKATRDQNLAEGKPPYQKVHIRTRGEVEWIFKSEGWSGEISLDRTARANLSGAYLRGVDLSGAYLVLADLSGAEFSSTNLNHAVLIEANLSHVNISHDFTIFPWSMSHADLRGANLSGAMLWAVDISGAVMGEADLSDANLDKADLTGASLEEANLTNASLREANLSGAILSQANLTSAHLDEANLSSARIDEANLSDADLSQVNLSGACLRRANLSGASLVGAIFDAKTVLTNAILSDQNMRLSDVTWGGANLVSVDWEPVNRLGDEILTGRGRSGYDKDFASEHKRKVTSHTTSIIEWKAAVRAYRLLSTALRDQGMNEEADRFTYRARVCQQQVFRYQHKFGRAFWDRFLDISAGYGFRPERTIVAYLSIISVFAVLFWAVSIFWHTVPATQPLSWYEAIFLSFSSFHGRGFFPSGITTGDPLAGVAVCEAVFGLFIEASFIATFTQRYFGR